MPQADAEEWLELYEGRLSRTVLRGRWRSNAPPLPDWGGFTTQDLKRCRFNAMAVALIYNWWSLFVRLANPKARLEAITSRPFLLSGVARKTRHGGQQHLVISHTHRHAHLAQAMLLRVSRMLQAWVKATAELLNPEALWQRVCEFLMMTLTGVNWLRPPPNRLAGAG